MSDDRPQVRQADAPRTRLIQTYIYYIARVNLKTRAKGRRTILVALAAITLQVNLLHCHAIIVPFCFKRNLTPCHQFEFILNCVQQGGFRLLQPVGDLRF